MSEVRRTRQSSTTEMCALCHDLPKYLAVGECDHPVCYRCMGKMRVLSDIKECSICRSDMPLVCISKELRPFDSLNTNMMLCHQKFNIYFENKTIKEDFTKLLENKCQECTEPAFARFSALNTHMRRKHQLYYCDLCIKHATLFPYERKTYNRESLAMHKRKGDVDDSAHKGHPLCEFCDERYFDTEQLWSHLRKDHYYCHFCEKDGRIGYYNSYSELRQHFRRHHYLCEEGECADAQFTNAFRSELDLQAHQLQEHPEAGAKKGKAKNVVNVEWTSSRPRGPRRDQPAGRLTGQDYEEVRQQARQHARSGARGYQRAQQQDDAALGFALQQSLKEAQKQAAVEAEKTKTEKSQSENKEKRKEKDNHVEEAKPEAALPSAPKPFEMEMGQFPCLNKTTSAASSSEVEQGRETSSSMAERVAIAAGWNQGTLGKEDFPDLGSTQASSTSLEGFRRAKNKTISSWGAAPKTTRAPKHPTAPVRPSAPQTSLPSSWQRLPTNDEEQFPGLTPAAPNVSVVQAPKPQPASFKSFNASAQDFPSLVNTQPVFNVKGAWSQQKTETGNELTGTKTKKKKKKAKESSKACEQSEMHQEAKADSPIVVKRNADGPVKLSHPEIVVRADFMNKDLDDKQGAERNQEPFERATKVAAQTLPKQIELPSEPSKFSVLEDTDSLAKTFNHFSMEEQDFPSLAVKKAPYKLAPSNYRGKQIRVTEEEFPSLSSTGKAPPGFGSRATKTARPSTSVKAPPGFKPSTSSLADIAASITPTEPKLEPCVEYQYVMPTEYGERNATLIEDIRESLDSEEFDKFKQLSRDFRNSAIDSLEYLTTCRRLIPSHLLPELLALLPDLSRQKKFIPSHNCRSAECRACQVSQSL